MADERAREEKGFTIVDRRAGREQEPPAPAEAGAGRASAAGAAASAGLPAIDFSTFVLSLGTSALYHLGLVPDPESGKAGEKDLALARQAIDTLEMLQAKTRGNLEEEERKLLESLLYELRMRFVEVGS